MDLVRGAPALHAALDALADQHVWLAGPTVDGRPTRWVPCACCVNVVAVGPVVLDDGRVATVVSTICEDCMAPCPDPDCGLLVYQHVDGCEPRMGERCP